MSATQTINNLTLAGSSTFARLVGTLALYSLLSHALGPILFGKFAYWYTIGIVLGAISDYGFGQQILTKISILKAIELKNEVELLTLAKLILIVILFSGGYAYAVFTVEYKNHLQWIVILFIACAISTLFEFFASVLKAQSYYSKDMFWSICGVLGGNTLAGVVGYLTQNLVYVCLVLFLARFLTLVGQVYVVKNITGLSSDLFLYSNVIRIPKSLKGGSVYAADNFFVQIFSNIDVLISKYLLTSHEAGIYLAGSRLVQAALSGIPVLASVFIPNLSRKIASGKKSGQSKSLIYSCILIAFISSILFYLLRNELPKLLFGSAFAELSSLLPLFGIAVAINYIAAVPGIHLSSKGLQLRRVYVHASAILIVASLLILNKYFSLIQISAYSLVGILLLRNIVQLIGYHAANKTQQIVKK